MKIVINTNYTSAGSRVCVDDLIPRLRAAGHDVTKNDWDHYCDYDLVLFMAPDSEVGRAKTVNPKAVVGIMDPKLTLSKQRREVSMADFLLVSSIEQREIFFSYNKNIVIYPMFPDIREIDRVHKQGKKIIIGYHGNKLHLRCFHPAIKKALEELGGKYELELRVLYNYKKLGRWNHFLPKNIKVTHLRWSEDAYYAEFSKCDIGIVNNFLPINNILGKFSTSFIKKIWRFNPFGFNHCDYLVRYKYSTNPGRVYVFSQLGIPVVADMTPSMCQIIQDGSSGFLVKTKDGWYNALEKLILNHDLRFKFSSNLRSFVKNNMSIESNFEKLNNYIVKLVIKK